MELNPRKFLEACSSKTGKIVLFCGLIGIGCVLYDVVADLIYNGIRQGLYTDVIRARTRAEVLENRRVRIHTSPATISEPAQPQPRGVIIAKERGRLTHNSGRKRFRIGSSPGFDSIKNRSGPKDIRFDGIHLPIAD
jgi:hypothetical protein